MEPMRMYDPEIDKSVTETGKQILEDTIVDLDTSDYDLEICKELRTKFHNARKQYVEFASRIAEKRSKFKVGDLVII